MTTVRCKDCTWEGDVSAAVDHGHTHDSAMFEQKQETTVDPIRAWKANCAGTCDGALGYHLVVEDEDDGKLYCDCPAFNNGRNCRHRSSVLLWLRAQPVTPIRAVGKGGWLSREDADARMEREKQRRHDILVARHRRTE